MCNLIFELKLKIQQQDPESYTGRHQNLEPKNIEIEHCELKLQVVSAKIPELLTKKVLRVEDPHEISTKVQASF